MLTTNDAVISAFNQLISAVQELEHSRGQCLGAPLKLELRRRTSWSFNEQILGFQRFGDFLKAAEAAGHIHLQRTPGGDFRISSAEKSHEGLSSGQSSAGAEIPLAASQTPSSLASSVRVRQDLWNAFNSVHDEWVYDRSQDVALRRRTLKPTGESELVSTPNGRELLMNWTRAFADTQTDDRKQTIIGMLEREGAPLNFLSYARMDSSLQRIWHRFHVQRVVSAIQSWAESNGVQPKDVIVPRWNASKIPPTRRLSSTGDSLPLAKGGAIAPESGLHPATRAALTERLGTVVDELIDKLIVLRGLISVLNL